MAPTFGSAGTPQAAGDGSSVVVGVPAGTVANSLVIAVIYVEQNVSVTPPAGQGWTLAPDQPLTTSGSELNGQRVYWKRSTAGESGTYTFTLSGSAYREGGSFRYANVITTGSPWDVTNGATRDTDGNTTPAVSVTTTGTERMLVFVGTIWQSGSWTPPTNFTERFDNGNTSWTAADRSFPAAGASGSITSLHSASDPGTGWVGALIGADSGTPLAASDSAGLAESESLNTSTPKTDSDAGSLADSAMPTLAAADAAALADSAVLAQLTPQVVQVEVEAQPVKSVKVVHIETAVIELDPQEMFGGGLTPGSAVVEVQAQPVTAGRSGVGQDTRGIPARVLAPRTRLIAQNVLTGQFLHWELPVTDPEVQWRLSASTIISGVFKPEIRELADVGLEPWATWIHLEEAGEIRGSGILQPTSIAQDGTLALSAEGPHSYASRIPYRDRYSRVGVDPAQVVRDLWAHIQSFPRGNLGVTVLGSTPITIGTEARSVDFVTGEGEQVSFVAGPYKLDYWENTLIGREIEELARETPFDFTEHSAWTDSGRTAVKHWIQIRYPQAGARRFDLRFVHDENLLEIAPIEEPEGAYADTVYVQGKGEGVDQVSGSATLWVGNRLRLPAILDDKTIDNTARANAAARDELGARLSALVEIPEVVIDTRHLNARLGTFGVGDELLISARVPYLGAVRQWHRLTSFRYLPDRNRAALALTRRGEYRGG